MLPELDVAAGNEEVFLDQHIADAEVLITLQFPFKFLKKATKLKWIQLTSAGVEQLLGARGDLGNILVTNTKGIHADVMADYTLGAIVMLHWNFPYFFINKINRRWDSRLTYPLAGRTLGIVGVGTIGKEITRRAQGFGLNVIGVKRNPNPTEGISQIFGPEGLREMLPISDFVVIVAPATPKTYHMIGESELQSMKKTGFLINISRGSVLDELALVKALQQGWIAGAVLDVFEKEPLPQESPLWGMDNVVITPHISGDFIGYVERVVKVFYENYNRWKDGRPLLNLVDLSRDY
jgi:phosphoglycerate dehydrogenase-like enzyme